MDNKLNKIFNIDAEDVVIAPSSYTKSEIIDVNTQNDVDEKIQSDYDKTRDNLHQLLKQGQDALNHALEVAKMSEHPRAFEVVGGLMKQLSDINHQLLDLHTKKSKLDHKETKDTPAATNITNNTMFVGNTTDLSKMIEQMRKDK